MSPEPNVGITNPNDTSRETAASAASPPAYSPRSARRSLQSAAASARPITTSATSSRVDSASAVHSSMARGRPSCSASMAKSSAGVASASGWNSKSAV